jgi:Sulfatase
MKPKTLLQGCGAAILALLLPVWSRLSPHHQALYHSFLPMQTVVRGLLLDLVVLALLATVLFWYLEKHNEGWRNLAWGLVAAVLAPRVATDIAAVLHLDLPHHYSDLLFYGVLLSAIGLRRLRPAIYLHSARAFQVLLLLAGLSTVWMVPELLFVAFRAQRSDTPVPMSRAALSPGQQNPDHEGRRIVWILFDELSYDQTFEHRFPGLMLPNFDKFKRESVSYANVMPAGPDTERVIPSLFLGRKIELIHADLDGTPSLRFAGQKGWQPLNPQATIFSDAQRLGWTTGLVGWYNPYCRILPETLNFCFWRMGDGLSDGTGPSNSSLQNAIVPLMRVFDSWRGKPDFSPEERHAADLTALMAQATTLIRDPKMGFVFIHVSVPHPPGIYDRKSGQLSSGGSYLDNLALADRVLGQLLATVDHTPQAANTSVILCSDHSWRVPLWRPTGFWTPEDELASRGRFDPRPVLMIHSPGQQSEQVVNAPFEALRVHEILQSLLRGDQPNFAPEHSAH